MLDVQSTLDALGEHRGQGVRVAIIDTGVEADHPWVGGRLVESFGVKRFDDGRVDIEACEPMDVCGHGTAAAGQIRRLAPQAELLSIRVLSETREGSSEALVAALQWVAKQRVDVVNMSLSTLRLALALRIGHAVDELYAKHVPCICAKGYQQDGRDYPTSFGASIGVTYDAMHPAELRYREGDMVEFVAAGVDSVVAWQNGSTRKVTGSSYATPLVAGLAARMHSARPGLSVFEIKTLLKAYADRYAKGWREDWMNKLEDAVASA
ncbi:MAG: S8 family serine peptidase [Phycisphaeraceae bacterium]